jgi:hypothetical protein
MALEESMSNNLLKIHSFNNFPREVNIFTSFLALEIISCLEFADAEYECSSVEYKLIT